MVDDGFPIEIEDAMAQNKELTVCLPAPTASECNRYETYAFDDALSFFNVLVNFQQVAQTFWPFDKGRRRWIFRGHWHENWELKPTAFRSDAFSSFREVDSILDPQKKLRKQIELESTTIASFMADANEFGIECNYSPELLSYQGNLRTAYKNLQDTATTEFIQSWPNQIALSTLALAQHHGIPTRLLDFSFNPLTSAYFASSGVFDDTVAQREERATKGTLCVWAVHEDDLAASLHREPIHRFWKIPAKSRRGSNIHSQSGLLILDQNANTEFLKNKGEWPDFLDIDDGQAKPSNRYPIKKLTLPQSQHRELLKLLFNQRVTPASIMPTLDKVNEAMLLQHWLERGED